MGARHSALSASRRSPAPPGPPEWEAFDRAWTGLRRDLARPGTHLLVEGERDRRSVRALGIDAPVLLVHQGARMPVVAEGISRSARVVVLLTDWDAAGGRLARRLADLLRDGRVDIDLEHRRRIGRALRGEVVHVEGLRSWAERRLAETDRTVDEWLREEAAAASDLD